jgi:hypothetical protein
MCVITVLGESVDSDNGLGLVCMLRLAFSSFDYDTVMMITTAWNDSLRCVKEFIIMATSFSKTDVLVKWIC